ncbi:MAG: hypothetical protein ABJA20_08195, partial [Novosphingobium sp.]
MRREPDLFGPEAYRQWFETYRQLREEEPVYQVPGSNLYVLTRYDDIAMVVRDSARFSNEAEKHGGEPLLLHPEARAIYEARGWPKAFPLAIDPPDHRRFRSLVNHFFTGARLEQSRALIEAHVHRLIDAFTGNPDIEFIAAFAEPLPASVISGLLGLPAEDGEKLKQWSFAWALPFA